MRDGVDHDHPALHAPRRERFHREPLARREPLELARPDLEARLRVVVDVVVTVVPS